MQLPLATKEKVEYCDHWSCNASHFDAQGCYTWMAKQLRPLQPARILDIGCGTGEGLLALLSAFSPTIVSLEENASCIRRSCKAVSSAGYAVEPVYRLGYQEFPDGSHDIVFDQTPIEVSRQVTLIHADALVDDPALLRLLAETPRFDAVTIWLIGTYMMRRTCRNISTLNIATGGDYRLHVQNRIYELADRVLRPGGWLQVVDRGEPPDNQLLRDNLLDSHRAQAQPTNIEVISLKYREYTEPTGRGVRMVASPGTSGRMEDVSRLAMISILSRKPAK